MPGISWVGNEVKVFNEFRGARKFTEYIGLGYITN